MVNVENIGEINLRPIEYCYIVLDQDYCNNTFKIRIPKLMPNKIDINDNNINKNIFINSIECRPHIRDIKLQDYITIKKSSSCNLPVKSSKELLVPNGTQVICYCINNNIKDMTIVDYVSDNNDLIYSNYNNHPTKKIISLSNDELLDDCINTPSFTPVSYWKDSNSIVHLCGVVTIGGSNPNILELKNEYIPLFDEIFGDIDNEKYVKINSSTGIIQAVGYELNDHISLSGIQFIANVI